MRRRINRKRRAIRWIATAVTLTVLCSAHGLGFLFPRQNLQYLEETTGCGNTDVLFARPDWNAGGVIYLSANEYAMLLVGTYPSLMGWQRQHSEVNDLDKDTEFYCDLVTFRMRSWEDYGGPGVTYLYGWVENPEITAVQMTCQVGMRDEYNSNITPGTEQNYVVTTCQKDWKEQDGRRYFMVRLEPLDRGKNRAEYQNISYTVLGDDGSTVLRNIT